MNIVFKKSFLMLCILLILLILAILSSCSSPLPKLDRKKPVTLNLWHHYIGEQKIVFDKYIEEFNRTEGKEKGIVVKSYSMENSGALHDKIIQAVEKEPGAPDMPDLFTVYPDTAYTLYNMGKLVSVEKYLDKNKLLQYVESFLENGRLTEDSGIIVLPIAKSTELLYINYTVFKRFLDEYNEKNPSDRLNENMLSSFEGILKTSKAYYNWTDAKTPEILNDGSALFGMDSPSNFAVAGCCQLSSSFFSINGKSGTIDLGNSAFRKLWDFYYVPVATGYFGSYSYYRSEDVQTGDLIMFTGSTAGANFFPKTVTYKDNSKRNIDLKVLPYPVFEGRKNTVVQQGAGLTVSKSIPKKEYASAIFFEWFTEPQRNTEFVLKTGYLPVTKEALNNILPKEMEKLKNNTKYSNVINVINVSLKMLKNYELYSYKPFEHSDEMRLLFEDKLTNTAKAGRTYFTKELTSSKDFNTIAKDIASKDRFDSFIEEVRNELIKSN